MMGVFYVVLVGTQAPVGFSRLAAACTYVESRPTAALYQWGNPDSYLVAGCYAIENGCERSAIDAEARGISMRPVVCAYRKRPDELTTEAK